MAIFEPISINNINAACRNNDLGFHFYDGKRVQLDIDFLNIASAIHVGGAGNVVYIQKDGKIGVILNAEVGWHYIVCTKILSSGVPNDNVLTSVSTTATNITYHGGI